MSSYTAPYFNFVCMFCKTKYNGIPKRKGDQCSNCGASNSYVKGGKK